MARRVDLKAILADPEQRKELMVSTLQATQAREGIDTTRPQAERAYLVVTEAERTAFFDLQRHRGGKGEPDRRQEMFVRSLSTAQGQDAAKAAEARLDVARRDFAAIRGAPLSYRRVLTVSKIFRDNPALDPALASAVQGLATADDSRFVRCWWEPAHTEVGKANRWVAFAKGGEYSRFFSDVQLRVIWTDDSVSEMQREGRVQNVTHYFKPGLTWPRRTQRGFNVRILPPDCIFADKGPAIFPVREADRFFLLGLANSAAAEYLLQGLMSFGSWEVGVIKRLPVPQPGLEPHRAIADLARSIHDAKAAWDEGNETCTRFTRPWLLDPDRTGGAATLSAALDALAVGEAAEEARIQSLYARLNDEVYRLYGIDDRTRVVIEDTLGERPPEVLWPQMEGKSTAQKRQEHVWRLLSYLVKQVMDRDEDGLVPFAPLGHEPSLLDRVRGELESLFWDRDPGQVETEIVNELKQAVKGYRRADSLADWLANCFFDFHVSLYRNRPILWHIASSQGTAPMAFGALVHYHRFDGNRLAKLRAQHLRETADACRREAAQADKDGRAADALEWRARLEEVENLDRRLAWVQEGRHEGPAGGDQDYRILTPWKSPAQRPKGWDPDLDDGVKVNIEPLQKAGVLRVAKVV